MKARKVSHIVLEVLTVGAIITSLGLGCAKRTDTGAIDSSSTTTYNNTTTPGSTTTTTTTPGTDTGTHSTASTRPSVTGPNFSNYSDANILAHIKAADSSEIALAKLALSKAKTSQAKGFAKMMVTEHSKMLADDNQLAKKLKIEPQQASDDMIGMETSSAYDRISNAAGGLDAAYLDDAVTDHQKDLDELPKLQAQAKSAEIKAAIDKVIPRVKTHLEHAQAAQSALSAKTH